MVIIDRANADTPKQASMRPLTVRFMFSHPWHIVSLGFGSGLLPLMPGTVGTLFGWGSFVILQAMLTPAALAALIVIGFALGIPACQYTAAKLGVKDPGAANWDEVVAFWLVLLLVMPATFEKQLAAFLIFRFFDIVKPPPIRYFDRNLGGGFGIMFDDMLAAFCTLLTLACWQVSVYFY
jgi:phosphatidylglycerophosphatase A